MPKATGNAFSQTNWPSAKEWQTLLGPQLRDTLVKEAYEAIKNDRINEFKNPTSARNKRSS